jgi:hypothetical protein
MDIDKILKEHSAAQAKKAPLTPIFELLARYILFRKQGFTSPQTNADFYVHGDVYDDTAVRAANTAVSSIIGALWKGGSRTFRLKRPPNIPETSATKTYYTELNRRVHRQFEHANAGFVGAFYEYMMEEMVFGTASFGVFKNEKKHQDNLLEFKAWSLKNCCVQENSNGYVDTIFYEFEYTPEQMVQEYGFEAVSEEVNKLAAEGNTDKKSKVLWLIRPRKNFDPNIKNPQNFPYESLHIEVAKKSLLKESGFMEFPMPTTRFYKILGEEYGRSPGMEALPSIVELNVLWETLTKAIEKHLFPSLYVLDDGSFGNGVIDLSPNAVNVLDMSTRITSGAPIGVIGETGELNSSLKLVEVLAQQILSHFFVDRLLDLNNQTRMTLGEAQIRNEMRSDSMGAVYIRQFDECLTPNINRGVRLLFEEGELGVIQGSPKHKELVALGKRPLIIPPEVANALAEEEDYYDLEYISPAARIIRSEELRGITSTWQFAAAFSPVKPEIMIGLDEQKTLELVRDLTGAPDEIRLSDEDIKKELKNYRDAQAEAMKRQMAQQDADAAAKSAAANQQNAQAQATQTNAGMAGIM